MRLYLLGSLFLFLLPWSSHASQEPASSIPEALVQQLIKDIHTNDSGFRLSDHDLETLRKNLKCKLEDINGDGAVEYFLSIDHPDWCGAGTNCDYWVYQKRATNYKLLLNEKQLKTKRSKTNGYRDLVSETPMGVIATGAYRFKTTLYKYDGKMYREVWSISDVKEARKKY